MENSHHQYSNTDIQSSEKKLEIVLESMAEPEIAAVPETVGTNNH